jgi:hypothetical protein
MKTLSDRSYGQIMVKETCCTSDLIVFEEEIHAPWIRPEGHSVAAEDLQWLLGRKPDLIIVDTGAYGVLTVPINLIDELAVNGIELICLRTAAAAKAYNERAQKGERVAACLHLTC